jgi:hypothetical protein
MAHEPTPETRAEVKAMTAFGVRQDAICAYIGITKPTLHKYYRKEIDTGAVDAILQVARAFFSKAVGCPEEGIPGDTTAQIFFLKTRAGWREIDRGEDNQVVVNFTIARDNGDSND